MLEGRWKGGGGWGNGLSKGIDQVGLSKRRKDWAKEIYLLTMDQLMQTQPMSLGINQIKQEFDMIFESL